MRIIRTTIIISLITFVFAKAQVDTTDWFPIQTGNYWEYMALTTMGPKYFSQKIIGDTLMPNGRTYKIICEEYFNPYSQDDWYLRKESEKVYRYYGDITACSDREYIYLNFSLPDSSIWQICRRATENARGIASTFYDYTYHDFLGKPNEAKQFEDVYVDSADTVWTPSDGSFPIVLNRGLGTVWHFRFNDGSYYLQGAIINGVRMGVITGVQNEDDITQKLFYLKSYPNPFNGSVTFEIILPESDISELSIYNLLGQKVAALFKDYKVAGNYKMRFNTNHLSSGIYIAVLKQKNLIFKEKIILLK